MVLANGQLVGAVWAPEGTKAAEVMREMIALNYGPGKARRGRPAKKREVLALEFSPYVLGQTPSVGMVLEPVPYSATFSDRYERLPSGAIIVQIGERLSAKRYREVAGALLAVIKPGCNRFRSEKTLVSA